MNCHTCNWIEIVEWFWGKRSGEVSKWMSIDFPVCYSFLTLPPGIQSSLLFWLILMSFSRFSMTHYVWYLPGNGILETELLSTRRHKVKIKHCLRDTHLAGSSKIQELLKKDYSGVLHMFKRFSKLLAGRYWSNYMKLHIVKMTIMII